MHESFTVRLIGIKNQFYALQYGMFQVENAENSLKIMIERFVTELIKLKSIIEKTIEDDPNTI